MVGVVIFSIGVPDVFASIDDYLWDNRVIVFGYVVMRLALVWQWSRVYAGNQEFRKLAARHIVVIVVAQAM